MMETLRHASVAQEDSSHSEAASVDQALRTILDHVHLLPAEEVPLAEAAGGVLAADITAPQDLWPFPRAAMDGYALRAADVAPSTANHPVTLRIAGDVFAGAASRPSVSAGTAVRIATGAPVPSGADVVVPRELVQAEGDRVVVAGALPTGKHIFPAGEDARRGEVVLRAGTTLQGGNLALLASLGITRISVVRRARVAILTVGDELVDPRETPGPGQVRESNSYALAAEVQAAGGTTRPLGIARDDLNDLILRIRRGLQADALIVCAGMSVGERDLVREALARVGVRFLFVRVPMKPGAPAAFGLAGTTPVFGLPGNPGAAMVAFEELVRPALRTMMGFRQVHRPRVPARLAASIRVAPGRRRYLWAHAHDRGGLLVQPLRGQGTATLRSISDANALVVVPPECEGLERGDHVWIQLLTDPQLMAESASPIPLLSIVGARNAGKTLLIERLLPELHRRGYRVGVIKHDVHGFEIDHAGTDTWRFAAAGADAVAIAGPEKVAVIHRAERAIPLAEVEELVRGVDLILIEGYGQEPIPKIEVRRSGIVFDKPPPVGPRIALVADGDGDSLALSFADIPALVDRIENEILFNSSRPESAARRPSS